MEGFLKESLWQCDVNDVDKFKNLKHQAYHLHLFRTSMETYLLEGKFIADEPES
jgi:hypothetical protein